MRKYLLLFIYIRFAAVINKEAMQACVSHSYSKQLKYRDIFKAAYKYRDF